MLRISPVEVRQGPQRSDSPVEVRRGPRDQELANEVRRGPLRSRAGSGGPARPTAIKSWQRRSGEEEEKEGKKEGRKEGRKGGGQLT